MYQGILFKYFKQISFLIENHPVMKTIYLIIFSVLLTACAVTKNKENASVTLIDYQIKENNVLRDTIWKMYNEMDRGIKKEYKLKNIKAKKNPDPSSYTLRFNDSVSKLTFHEPMFKDDGKSFHSYSNPLGRISFRIRDSVGIYKDYSQKIEGAYQKTGYKNLKWKNGTKDSIILGIKTHLMIGENSTTEVKAWTTNKFPSDLGIYDVHIPKSFILAYEIKEKQPEMGYKIKNLKVYPEEIKKAREKIEVPEWTREVSEKEIEEYYRKLNERNNG